MIFLSKKFLFIYLAVPGLTWGMWDLVPWPGIKPGPPALGAQGLKHWTTREVPAYRKFKGLSHVFVFVLCWWWEGLLVRLTAQHLWENAGISSTFLGGDCCAQSHFLATEKCSYLGFLETTIYSVLSIKKKLLLGIYQVINGLQIAFPSLIWSL